MFKNHLEMIGRNEPVSKKARFWQSYVRSLKGSDDIRAPESAYRPRSSFRPLSSFPEYSSTWPLSRSIYDEPSHPSERITIPGYRYLPIHRETYGYSPRDLYPRRYDSLDRYRPSYHVPKKYQSALFDHSRAWQDHLDRMTELDARYPSRYGLLLKDRSLPVGVTGTGSTPSLKGLEYEPDNKPPFGRPIYSAGGYGNPLSLRRRPWYDLLNPSRALPISAVTRDPWWWDVPGWRPHDPFLSWGRSPFFLRDSYLSPVKRTYLWDKHPARPLASVR